MIIRKIRAGEEAALRQIYVSAVHLVAKDFYSPEQCLAWAPRDCDMQQWTAQIQRLDPWVIEDNGEVVAYADLQTDGYIDHFYVSGLHGRKGYAHALMAHLLAVAATQGISRVHARVSLAAKGFFLKQGFCVCQENYFEVRGVPISNVTMEKQIVITPPAT